MKNYIYQPQHHFIYITFVVVAIGEAPFYCGDNYMAALERYYMLKKMHKAPQIWDCSGGRNGVNIRGSIRIW